MSIQNYISLEPIKHQYFDTDGREYASVSKVLKEYENGPDWDSIAGKVAGNGKFKNYPTKESVLALWKENATKAMDYGTSWHNAIERYQKEFTILPEDKDKEEMIKSISYFYKDYYRVHSEVTLYHPQYMIAGTSDKILIPKKGGNTFCVCDYKTALQTGGIDYWHKDDTYMLDPVGHLQSSKYSKYNIQLSIYSLMMETLTGMKCRNMWVTFIKQGNPVQIIPMPYLKNEAISILQHYSENHLVHKAEIINDVVPTFDSL